MSKIDLHIHSRFSRDGEYSVSEILNMCKVSGMELVSIADHNSVKGVSEALENSGELCVISGVELDCVYRGIIFHLLGYGFDHTRDEFYKIEEDIFSQEKETSKERVRLFQNTTGIPVDITEVLAASYNGVATGELIGEVVLAKENVSQYEILKPYLPGGEKTDMPNVNIYWDFFSPGKPAYVPMQYISLAEGIAIIHKAQGIAVLAHPGKMLSGNIDLLDDITALGIDGIEAFSSYHSADESVFFQNYAKQNRLLISCGSDFHGKNKPLIKLGDHGAVMDDKELMDNFINSKFAIFAEQCSKRKNVR